jgi:uncharacterized repeat protein (TIGR03803 family)
MNRVVHELGKLSWGKRAYAVLALFATTAIALPAQTFTTLHSFDATDGQGPVAGLVQATNGDFYGTTYYGGANEQCMSGGAPIGCGTVFKMTPSGTLTTLYSFCSQSGCTDGETPWAGLVQATNGDFYGTTEFGGANAGTYGGGAGTVFKITPSGTLTTLYSFCSQSACTDGEYPMAGLVQATNGDLYGTTEAGGYSLGSLSFGTVFKITPGGTLTTLYDFGVPNFSGVYPYAGLIQATNGNFYGTTDEGGFPGFGTVFKITPSGALTIYSFCTQSGFNCPDGANPYAGLVQATNGDFYGTTYSGGGSTACANGCGTVFKVTPSGTLTTLYSFCAESGCTDGANPLAGLVQATDGNFYGTTSGGADSGGTVFKVTPSGTLTTLYSFGYPEGSDPMAGLVQATNGTFYGTTYAGGAYSGGAGACLYVCGTVFSLSVGLGPFVETQPTSGPVGTAVKILGSDLTGATSVTFNGTPQPTFTVVSRYLITTTVPAGATTGKVQVVIPSRTLSSNVPFRVP